MGCCFDNSAKVNNDRLAKLNNLKGRLTSTIEINKIKISSLEKELSDYDAQIKQGENDLKQNRYSYSESEMKNKAQKLMDLHKDRNRTEKSLESMRTYNETLKNNLNTIKNKIDEINNAGQIEEGNKLLDELKGLDTGDILRNNIQGIMEEKEKEDRNIGIMKQGNDVINADLGIKDADDYLKSLLGGGSPGAPPAY